LMRTPSSRRKKIMVEITDNGEGISSVKRGKDNTSEIEDFFNLSLFNTVLC